MGEKLLCVFYLVNYKVSLTNLSQILGGLGDELRALVSKSSIKRFAMTGLRGDPMAAPFTCS